MGESEGPRQDNRRAAESNVPVSGEGPISQVHKEKDRTAFQFLGKL